MGCPPCHQAVGVGRGFRRRRRTTRSGRRAGTRLAGAGRSGRVRVSTAIARRRASAAVEMAEQLLVADRLPGGARPSGAGGEAPDLVERGRRRAMASTRACDPPPGLRRSTVSRRSGPATTGALAGARRRTTRTAPGQLHHLERTHDPAAVAGFDPRGRGRVPRSGPRRAGEPVGAGDTGRRSRPAARDPRRGKRRSSITACRYRPVPPRAAPDGRVPRSRRSRTEPRPGTARPKSPRPDRRHRSGGGGPRPAPPAWAWPCRCPCPRYTCIESIETSSTSPSRRPRRGRAPTCPTRSGRRERDGWRGSARRDRDTGPARRGARRAPRRDPASQCGAAR